LNRLRRVQGLLGCLLQRDVGRPNRDDRVSGKGGDLAAHVQYAIDDVRELGVE
jgi:hypothetical protein